MVKLHDAAGKGDIEAVRTFLSRYAAQVNQTNRNGQTALHLAAKGGHVEVCRELISSKSNIDVEDKIHHTPLRVAVENNKARVARVLCEAGASTSLPDPVDRRTPLHVAAKKGFVECAEILVQHGAIIDGNPDKWGHLPDEDCITAEIRILIEKIRRERATSGTYYYELYTPTAPPHEDDLHHSRGAESDYYRGVPDHNAASASCPSRDNGSQSYRESFRDDGGEDRHFAVDMREYGKGIPSPSSPT